MKAILGRQRGSNQLKMQTDHRLGKNAAKYVEY